MNTGVLVLTSMGGIVAFVSGIVMVIRAILNNVGATRDNTKALQNVEKALGELSGTVEQHTVDIAVLQDRQKR